MAYYDRWPTFPEAQRNRFASVHDDRRNDYVDEPRNGFKAAGYEGTPFMEVPLPESKPPPPGLLSNIWTIPQYVWNSWLSRGSTASGHSSVVRVNRTQDSERSNRFYGSFEGKGVSGARLGQVDSLSRGVDDHQRFPARNEAYVSDLEVRVKEKEGLERRIEHSEKRLKDLESDFIAKSRSYYVEMMRADELEQENRECQERLRGLSLEKTRAGKLEREKREYMRALSEVKARADALEKEKREFQGTLQGLQSQKARGENLERDNRELQAKLQMKEREVGELQGKLQAQANAGGAATAALEVRDAELKILQSSFQEVRRENQELKRWKLEQERRLENDKRTTGELNTKVLNLTAAHEQLEKQKQQLATNVQDQAKRIQELKQQVSVMEVKIGAKDSEAQSLRERLWEEREKSSKLSEALQQKNSRIEELTEGLEQKNTDAIAPAENGALREPRELKAQAEPTESETLSLKARLREELENTARLSERLQQCDLEIDDLKHQIRELARARDSDSIDFLIPPPPPPPADYSGGESFLETEATPYLLDGAVQRVHEVAGIFARLLMKAMEQGKIDGMAVARNSFVRSISHGKAAPLKYVLEAITCKLLFQGFEHDSFDLQDCSSGFLDMEQQRRDNFREYKYLSDLENPERLVLKADNLFAYFCRTKLENLSTAIPEIEGMVQEIIVRTFERPYSSDDSAADVAGFLAAKLGVTFVKLAVCVWQVHKLAFSFNPMARIFRVAQSEKLVEKYMESVIFQESESDEDDDRVDVDVARVDFMVVPGFLINRIVIRSKVYVVTRLLTRAFWIPNGT